MISAVADTHTAIWYLFGDPRLSRAAFEFIDQSVKERKKIAISAITLAEVVYLGEKGRVPAGTLVAMVTALRRPDGALQEVPVDAAIVEQMENVSRLEVPDMPDRIVAATALRFGVPIISRDRKIQASKLNTIW
jgi:PIN domain nuclease of toxin-antitoxin system